jgi:hypothetical protein
VFTGGWQFFSRHQYTWPGDLFCVDFRAWRLSLAPARATYIGHGKDTGLEDRRTHVSGRYSSVNQATSMLAHLGVDKIIYVGLDLAPRSDGLRRAGDTELDTPDAGARYQRMADNLHTMAKPLRARGIEVVNASPTDRLPWWPKMTLREATSI